MAGNLGVVGGGEDSIRKEAVSIRPELGCGPGEEDHLTLLQQLRQGVLTNEIVSGFPVIVFDHKTQQGQFRYQDRKQCLPQYGLKPEPGRVSEGRDEGTNIVDRAGELFALCSLASFSE